MSAPLNFPGSGIQTTQWNRDYFTPQQHSENHLQNMQQINNSVTIIDSKLRPFNNNSGFGLRPFNNNSGFGSGST